MKLPIQAKPIIRDNYFSVNLLFNTLSASGQCYSTRNCSGQPIDTNTSYDNCMKNMGNSWRDAQGHCHSMPIPIPR